MVSALAESGKLVVHRRHGVIHIAALNKIWSHLPPHGQCCCAAYIGDNDLTVDQSRVLNHVLNLLIGGAEARFY
jgi:hypothetical protein